MAEQGYKPLLNIIWIAFFLVGFVLALWQWLVGGNHQVLLDVSQSTFDMSKLAAEIALGLVGILSLWTGLFNVAQHSGIIQRIGRLLEPLFIRLMPEIPRNHPALGSITLNLSANMLGLDNAATPLGLKAMADLQQLNPQKDTASNAQILFLVLNTSSVTLIPITIFMYRAQLGAENAADVFVPILLATSASTLTGLLVVCLIQRIKLYDPVILAYLLGFSLAMSGFVFSLLSLSPEQLSICSRIIASVVLLGVIGVFLVASLIKRQDTYGLFVEGAKEGFETSVRLIPYLVAMLVAIGVLRSSGALTLFCDQLAHLVRWAGLDTAFVEALPVALMKPLSGSGARAMMLEVMNQYGVDSFLGRLAAVMQGSTETTFYVLAVYFGSVGIVHVRYAIWCGLLADLSGVVAAVGVCYWFF